MGVFAYIGNSPTTAKWLSMFRSWFATPMRTRPSTNVGLPFAWKVMRSSGVPTLPVAWLVPVDVCCRNERSMACAPPVTSGPPILAVGSARRTPSTVKS